MRLFMVMVLLILVWTPSFAQESEYCILRKPMLYGPNDACFEFYQCDASIGTRCNVSGGSCVVTPLAAREGWEVDPNAHPAAAPGPYTNWEAADYVMTVLSPYSGDWYGCFGQPSMELPERQPVLDAETETPGYCILRKADLYQPTQEEQVCFQFHLADTTIPLFPAGTKMATISGGACFATSYASRQGYEIDPWLGGPYDEWTEGDAAMGILSMYGDDFYGCLEVPEEDETEDSGAVGGSTEESWIVWYADNIGFKPIYITTKAKYEEDTPSCDYPGGGIDCSVKLKKIKLLGPFSSGEEANDAICSKLTNFRRGSCGPASVYCGMPWADYEGAQHNIENLNCEFD